MFEDGNCPGMVYFGGEPEMDALRGQGGYPIVVSAIRIQDGKVKCAKFNEDGDLAGFEWVEPQVIPSHWVVT